MIDRHDDLARHTQLAGAQRDQVAVGREVGLEVGDRLPELLLAGLVTDGLWAWLRLRRHTHRIEAERELERARQELFQAQKMESLGHLTGGVGLEQTGDRGGRGGLDEDALLGGQQAVRREDLVVAVV